MNAKSIELQVEANNREARQIQQQLSQIAANSPLFQQLNNRLEMIKRAQDYWAKEYFKLTGKQLGVVSPPLPPPPTPNSPAITPNNSNNGNQDSMAEWQKVREKVKQSLAGNQNQARVEAYLYMLERAYGGQAPKIPGVVLFGKAEIGGSGVVQDFNASVVRVNSSIYFEGDGAVVIFSDGTVVTPTPNTLVVIYGPPSYKGFTGKVEMNPDEVKKVLQALRGD